MGTSINEHEQIIIPTNPQGQSSATLVALLHVPVVFIISLTSLEYVKQLSANVPWSTIFGPPQTGVCQIQRKPILGH